MDWATPCIKINVMRWLIAPFVIIGLTGCRPTPVTQVQPTQSTRVVFNPWGVESFARRAYDELESKGVRLGELEAHGHGKAVNVAGGELQDYSLSHQGTYRSRPVSIQTWVQLETKGNRTRVFRGRVLVADPQRGEVLTVKL